MDAYQQTTALLTERITQYESGLLKWDTADILKIRAALLAERPTADHYLTVLLNEFEFLTNEFEMQDGETPSTISRFLNEFKASIQRDLLSRDGTQQDGMILSSV